MKKYIFVLAILGVLILAGCKGGSKDNAAQPTESPYIGGDNGIIAEFEQMGVIGSTGKSEIWQGETFPIEVILKNKGEKDVLPAQAKVELVGIDLNDFSGIVVNGTLTNIELIEKLSNFNKEGGELTLDFTPNTTDALYLINFSGSTYTVDVFARYTYYYETYASVPQVCFKEDLNDETVCNAEEEKTAFSSGAPIQVKKATERTAGTAKIAVEFEIENVGKGVVTKPGTSFDVRYSQLVYNVSEPDEWECKSGGKLNEARLADKKATIICKLINAMPEDTLFTKQLDLTLKYDYKELVDAQVTIKKQ